MNKRQTIRLNESQFNNLVTKIVKESVKRVLKERYDGYNVPNQLQKVINQLEQFEKYSSYNGKKLINLEINYSDGYSLKYIWTPIQIIDYLNKLNSGELDDYRLLSVYYTTIPKDTVCVRVGSQDERDTIDNYDKQYN